MTGINPYDALNKLGREAHLLKLQIAIERDLHRAHRKSAGQRLLMRVGALGLVVLGGGALCIRAFETDPATGVTQWTWPSVVFAIATGIAVLVLLRTLSAGPPEDDITNFRQQYISILETKLDDTQRDFEIEKAAMKVWSSPDLDGPR